MPLLLKDFACSKNRNVRRNGHGERGNTGVIVGWRMTRSGAGAHGRRRNTGAYRSHTQAYACMFIYYCLDDGIYLAFLSYVVSLDICY